MKKLYLRDCGTKIVRHKTKTIMIHIGNYLMNDNNNYDTKRAIVTSK